MKHDTNCDSEKETYIGNLCYRLKKITKQYIIKQSDGKMECPFCKIAVKNIKLHFDRNSECAQKIDMVHFSESYNDYKKMLDKNREQLKRNEQAKKHKK